MTKMQKKLVADYIAKYKIDIVFSPGDECYVVNIPELPGCMTHGETQEEALKMAREAIEGYLEALVKHGDPLPVPMAERKYPNATKGVLREILSDHTPE